MEGGSKNRDKGLQKTKQNESCEPKSWNEELLNIVEATERRIRPAVARPALMCAARSWPLTKVPKRELNMGIVVVLRSKHLGNVPNEEIRIWKQTAQKEDTLTTLEGIFWEDTNNTLPVECGGQCKCQWNPENNTRMSIIEIWKSFLYGRQPRVIDARNHP